MKKNKLIFTITTTKTYQYLTEAETADIAMDEMYNDSGKKLKLLNTINENYEIYDFIINKPTKGKK